MHENAIRCGSDDCGIRIVAATVAFHPEFAGGNTHLARLEFRHQAGLQRVQFDSVSFLEHLSERTLVFVQLGLSFDSQLMMVSFTDAVLLLHHVVVNRLRILQTSGLQRAEAYPMRQFHRQFRFSVSEWLPTPADGIIGSLGATL